ncbi:hypothetical protein Tco_0454511 [Tanacetum coccineum]
MISTGSSTKLSLSSSRSSFIGMTRDLSDKHFFRLETWKVPPDHTFLSANSIGTRLAKSHLQIICRFFFASSGKLLIFTHKLERHQHGRLCLQRCSRLLLFEYSDFTRKSHIGEDAMAKAMRWPKPIVYCTMSETFGSHQIHVAASCVTAVVLNANLFSESDGVADTVCNKVYMF